MKLSRNEFLKLSTGFGVSGLVAITNSSFLTPPPADTDKDELVLGVSSYTFRKFSIDDTIKMSLRLGIKNISIKAFHMPLDSKALEITMIAKKIKDAGMNLYGAGVIYMKTPEDVENSFAYAATAGIGMIVGAPNHELLPLINEKVQSTNIRLAIHNHGPGDDMYRSPNDVYEKIKGLDNRIGMCIDIGHVVRIGEDPVPLLAKYKHRLYDMHMKDIDKAIAEGGPIEIGHGIIDIPKVIKTLKKIKYKGMVTFEYEKDGDDPMPGFAESVGYIRGVMKMT